MVAEADLAVVDEREVEIGIAVVAPMGIFSETGVQRRLDIQVFADRAEKAG